MQFHINFKKDWQFLLDSKNIGEEVLLFAKIPSQSQKITLPHIWENPSIEEPSNVGYYFKEFTIPNKEISNKYTLHFESVYHFTKIWINQKKVGEHLGGGVPFSFDISKFVSFEKNNSLSIRVEKPNHDGILNDFSDKEIPIGPLQNGHLFAGITGAVNIKGGQTPSIKQIDCYPDYEGNQVTIETHFFCGKNKQLEVLYSLTDPSGYMETLPKIVRATKENHIHEITFKISNGKVWSLEDPNLYKIEVKLTNGSSISTLFGLRRVEIDKSMIRLNHENQPFRGVQFKQKFPFSYVVPNIKQDLKQELTLLKQSGFNLIRSGGIPLNHTILDLCDSLGIMVIQETTTFLQKSSKKGFQILNQHIKQIITEYQNHASIVAWGIGSDNGSMILENGNKLLKFTSNIDPFRPIISNFNSVFIDSSNAEEIDKGKIFSPTTMKISQFESHRFYLAFPLRSKTEMFLTHYCSNKNIQDGVHGRKSFWEKYNYIRNNLEGKVLIGGLGVGTPYEAHALLKDFRRYKNTKQYIHCKSYYNKLISILKKLNLWKSPDDFFQQCNQILENSTLAELSAILSNPQISGYMFESWTDEDNLYKGLTDWNRKPKPLLKKITAFHNNPKILPQFVTKTPYFNSYFNFNLSFLVEEEDFATYTPTVELYNSKNKCIGSQTIAKQTSKKSLVTINDINISLQKEIGFLDCKITLKGHKNKIFSMSFPLFIPPLTNIDKALNNLDFQGISSPFIQIQNKPKAKKIVINKIEKLSLEQQKSSFERVKNGATLILSQLQADNIDIVNNLNILPSKVELSYCAWAEGGSYHLAQSSSVFKHIKDPILGTIYADILPQWSISAFPKATVYASCLNLHKDSIENKLTLFSIPLGKGKVVFCQFDIFNDLGKNALVDYLFMQLVQKT